MSSFSEPTPSPSPSPNPNPNPSPSPNPNPNPNPHPSPHPHPNPHQVNLLPLAVALSLDADPAHYTAGTGYFSALATRAGGWWLGKLFFVASMVSNLGNYASQAPPG